MNCAGQPHDFWQKNREMVSFKDACVQLWGPLAGTTGEVGEVVEVGEVGEVGFTSLIIRRLYSSKDNQEMIN